MSKVESRRPSSRHRIREDRISATDASKNFGRLVDRVREERADYVIERSGQPVARIGPIDAPHGTLADLKALVAAASFAGDDYASAVERAVRRHNKPRVRRNPWAR